ncbi:MAG: glycosyltransferase N-terminal domain-containing protein [Rickettsiales bacterium]
MIEFLYTIINILLLPVLLVNLLYRGVVGKEDLYRIHERLGFSFVSRPQGKLYWIHAASVGEAMSVSNLVNYLHARDIKIVFTSYTLNSAKAIKKKYGEKVVHQFIPLENYFAIKLFLNKWKPDLAVFVESEFWPVIIYQTSKKANIISINTRISKETRVKWNKFSSFAKSFLNKIKFFYPQTVSDLNFLKEFGLRNAKYLGNLKYNVKKPIIDEYAFQELSKAISERKSILLFSSHKNEEEVLIKKYIELKKEFSDLLLIIAPRHPERRDEIINIINNHKLSYKLRSKKQEIDNKTQIYLADTIGELPVLFRVSSVNVVGGSLNQDIGGHNPIEPALQAKASLMGPYHYNFNEIVDEFQKDKAIFLVKNIGELDKEVAKLLKNPELVREYGKNAFKLVREKAKMTEKIFSQLSKEEE